MREAAQWRFEMQLVRFETTDVVKNNYGSASWDHYLGNVTFALTSSQNKYVMSQFRQSVVRYYKVHRCYVTKMAAF